MALRSLAAASVLAMPAARVARAQTASLAARAEIDVTALAVLNVRGVDFGTVPPGLATSVDPRTSPQAGKFEIRGTRNAEVSVTLTLPAALTVGAFAMPVGFGATGACYRNRDQQPLCAYFDPSVPLVTRLRNRPFPDNLVVVWVGGTVTPALTQFPGVYRASITLTAAYTGN